ncbi:MAG: hypothetical protein ABMB14_23185, partial [Myxococcota bacterium]
TVSPAPPVRAHSDRELLDLALNELALASPRAPSGPSVVRLVERLTPAIQARVVRAFLRFGWWRVQAQLAERTRDQVQVVWAKLFENEARVLRAWREDGGLSLEGWVGRFAALRTRDAVRDMGRQPCTEGQPPPESFGFRAEDGSPEDQQAARELWRKARESVMSESSELGRTMFELLLDQDLSMEEIQERTNMTPNTVQQWRSRIRAALRATFDRLSVPDRGGE